jgi:hypothetical protein
MTTSAGIRCSSAASLLPPFQACHTRFSLGAQPRLAVPQARDRAREGLKVLGGEPELQVRGLQVGGFVFRHQFAYGAAPG